ncbi:glycosyltransferase [Corynebacterium sp. CNCTC7651]|nr:glycosyltransferase [Corynebacterium sp. CNCTC7651]
MIADYGSESSTGFRERLEAEGAHYHYFETDGVWSRSRALNLGVSRSRGRFIVTTDADMIFSPTTFPRILEMLESDPWSYYIVQCRDLPEGISHADVLEGSVSFEELEYNSQLRPRWGMGGLIAFSREAFDRLRGLDERLEIYGGEDIDLAKRLMRCGLRRVWVTDPDVRMFHVWHPSSLKAAENTKSGKQAVERNREVHKNDASTIRNLSEWNGKSAVSNPLVTVAISTFNRAEFLPECLASVFAQTFRDFEVIVVNDGSTDNTKEVLESIDDPRLRVIHQENRGLAAARNRITAEARGTYIAVHDDDDLMLPTRLADQLRVLGAGVNGAYGGWVDFDNETGDLIWNRGKGFSLESLAFNSGIYLHPTLLVERRLMELVPYTESMRSGSDYNLAVRLARSGANLQHCGKYVILRRGHEGQITNQFGHFQKASGRISGALARASFGPHDREEAKKERPRKDWVKVIDQKDAEPTIRPYLPDHLVSRRGSAVLSEDQWVEVAHLPEFRGFELAATYTHDAGTVRAFEAEAVSLADAFALHGHLGSAIQLSEDDVDSFAATAGDGGEFEPIVSTALGELPAGEYIVYEYLDVVDTEDIRESSAPSLWVELKSGDTMKIYVVRDAVRDAGEASIAGAAATWEFVRKGDQ